jgi:hypothetical protein
MNPLAPIFYPNNHNHYANNPEPEQWIPDGPRQSNVIQTAYPPPILYMVRHPMPPRYPRYKSQETQTLKSKFRPQDGTLPMTLIVPNNNNEVNWTQQCSPKPEVRSKMPEIRPAYQNGQVLQPTSSSPSFSPAYNHQTSNNKSVS